MPDTFTQYLILFLIGLLFAKDYLIAPLLKKYFGVSSTNGNGSQKQIDALERHAEVANDEMGRVEERLNAIENRIGAIERDVSFIRGKLDA